MESQSIDFIKESTGISAASFSKQTELLTNPYFSVYRNPKTSRDRWKTEISEENRRQIIEIVSESKIFQMGNATRLMEPIKNKLFKNKELLSECSFIKPCYDFDPCNH